MRTQCGGWDGCSESWVCKIPYHDLEDLKRLMNDVKRMRLQQCPLRVRSDERAKNARPCPGALSALWAASYSREWEKKNQARKKRRAPNDEQF
jgi:hypothetical protein